jgi:hypothetical protein
MSLELVNTLATFGTFFVIAATAIAALVQLRHARGSNQIAALDELRTVFQSREFSDAQAFLETRLGDLVKNPAFRYQWANRGARTEEFRIDIERVRLIGNYFEDVGALIAAGLLDAELTSMIYSSDVVRAWELMEPITAMARRVHGNQVWVYFEYAATLARRWRDAHADGGYPQGAPRWPIVDEWLEADKQYAASLAAASP